MAAVSGDKFSVGPGLWCVSDTVPSTDTSDFAVETGGVKCEIVSIHFGSTSVTATTIIIKDASGNRLINTHPSVLTSQLSVPYPTGGRPRLLGLSITLGAITGTVNYSIVYRIVP